MKPGLRRDRLTLRQRNRTADTGLPPSVASGLDRLARELGISKAELAAVIRHSDDDAGPEAVAGALQRRYQDLCDLHHHIMQTFTTKEFAKTWVHASNGYLREESPATMIRQGRFDRAESALGALEHGIFL